MSKRADISIPTDAERAYFTATSLVNAVEDVAEACMWNHQDLDGNLSPKAQKLWRALLAYSNIRLLDAERRDAETECYPCGCGCGG